MRIYQTFKEAQNEIARDLAELGTLVRTETMQDKYIEGLEEFDTKELLNYDYQVLSPDLKDISGVHEAWVKQEWEDRLAGGLNPGTAWWTRKEVWEQFLEETGSDASMKHRKFSYTYSTRMGGHHIEAVIEELKKHPHSRQLYLPVWAPIDEERRGIRRVPCSLGYQFINRNDALHVTYFMRSCDFFTHYGNDVALATALMQYIALSCDLEPGTFTHNVTSLHAYRKDLEGIF